MPVAITSVVHCLHLIVARHSKYRVVFLNAFFGHGLRCYGTFPLESLVEFCVFERNSGVFPGSGTVSTFGKGSRVYWPFFSFFGVLKLLYCRCFLPIEAIAASLIGGRCKKSAKFFKKIS
jgi:hypothetical protein